MKKVLILLLLLNIACGSSISESESESELNNNKPNNVEGIGEIETTEKPSYIAIENKYIYDQLVFTELGDDCAPYLGQSINIRCFNKFSFFESYNFEIPLVSIVKYKKNYYVLEKSGKLYKFDFIDQNLELMIDFSEKVDDSIDRGAKGFAFSEDEKTFAISYVNELKQLKVDLYRYENNFIDFKFEKNLLSIQNEYDSISWHYGGHIIWSEQFDGYVVGIGDFLPAGPLSRTNENPLKTNSFIGKLILLDSKIETNYQYQVLKNNLEKSHNNILAIGLRNPWQFFEIGGFFVIPDVGFSVNEEINITKIDKFPVNFGWPVYEGELLSEEIDSLKNFNLYLSVYENNVKVNEIINHTKQNSVTPVFTYNHNPYEGFYRGAIIGGDVFSTNSEFKDNIVFGDHISGELFLYNIKDKSVLISPFGLIKGGPSSIKIFDEIKDTIIVTTVSGEIHLITLSK